MDVHIRRQAENVSVALVRHHESRLRIEHAQTLGHVLQGSFEKSDLLGQSDVQRGKIMVGIGRDLIGTEARGDRQTTSSLWGAESIVSDKLSKGHSRLPPGSPALHQTVAFEETRMLQVVIAIGRRRSSSPIRGRVYMTPGH